MTKLYCYYYDVIDRAFNLDKKFFVFKDEIKEADQASIMALISMSNAIMGKLYRFLFMHT